MTHEEMAIELKQAGWIVVPPPRVESMIPEPAVGQTWVSAKPGIAPRVISELGQRYGWLFVRYTMRDGSPGGSIGQSNFRQWARKHNARPA